jgi:C1A family cysteine protease
MKLPKFILKVNFVTLYKLFKRYILREKPIIHNRKLFLKPDKWDERDFIYKARKHYALIPETTNRENFSQFHLVYDQKNLGSCGLNAFMAVFRRVLQINNQPDFDGSRLFGYYISRGDDEKGIDSGVSLRDMFKAINKYGICCESTWPYIIEKFADTPPDNAFSEAENHQVIRYERIYPVTREAIMDALYHHFPIIFGLKLYESFMSDYVARTGIVPVPKWCEKEQGGHALASFDYEPKKAIGLNSWGEEWGQKGLFEMPWELLTNPKYCQDVWVLYQSE